MLEVLRLWEDRIGRKRTARLAEMIYTQQSINDFDADLRFTGNTSILNRLEQVGRILLDTEFLVVDEKRDLLNILALELVSKTLSPVFTSALNEIFNKEFEQENWLEEEINEIRELLDDLEKEKEFE